MTGRQSIHLILMNPNPLGILTLLAGLAACLAGCQRQAVQEDHSDRLAKVGDSEVTVADLSGELKRRPGLADTPENRGTLLKELIRRRVLAKRARELGLLEDPEVRRGIENLLIGRLRAVELEPRLGNATVDDEEIANSYAASVERYQQPGMLRLAALHLPSHKDDATRRTSDREKLNLARSRSLDPGPGSDSEGFGSWAIDCTEDQASRYRGGVLGWLHEGGDYPDWRRTAVQIGGRLSQPGEVSEIVETAQGLLLVKLLDRRLPERRSLASVRTEIQRELLRRKRERIENQFDTELLQATPIERDLARLQSPGLIKASRNSVVQPSMPPPGPAPATTDR